MDQDAIIFSHLVRLGKSISLKCEPRTVVFYVLVNESAHHILNGLCVV